MHEEVERRTPVHVVGGCVGEKVGDEVTHAGLMNLQNLPGTSTGDWTASMFNSKVVR